MQFSGEFPESLVRSRRLSAYSREQLRTLNRGIELERLLHDQFIRTYTDFDSFDAFAAACPLCLETAEPTEFTRSAAVHVFVRHTTDFEGTTDLLRNAVADFVNE